MKRLTAKIKADFAPHMQEDASKAITAALYHFLVAQNALETNKCDCQPCTQQGLVIEKLVLPFIAGGAACAAERDPAFLKDAMGPFFHAAGMVLACIVKDDEYRAKISRAWEEDFRDGIHEGNYIAADPEKSISNVDFDTRKAVAKKIVEMFLQAIASKKQ